MTKKMSRTQALEIAQEIAGRHGMQAQYEEGCESVGVVGDNRSFEPVLTLFGDYPGHETAEAISNEISSRTPITRVTVTLAAKE